VSATKPNRATCSNASGERSRNATYLLNEKPTTAPDGLINNAAIATGIASLVRTKSVAMSTPHTMAVNVRGTWLMSRTVIPHMLERGRGAIINNCSVLGLKACPGAAAYNTSKGAISQMTRSMALELAGTGIRVNAICPGTIVTPMVSEVFAGAPDPAAAEAFFLSQHPIGRFGTEEEIARACLLLAQDGMDFMTGSMLSVDGGWGAR